MKTQEFLSELRNLGIRLSTDGEKLRCNAPKDSLTPSLQIEIIERKAEIIAFLQDTHLSGNSSPSQIQPVPRNQNLPLSFSQQRLWFLDQLEPNSPLYNILRALRLHGDLNIQVLQQTLDAVVAHHEVLRTKYVSENGEPRQVISTPQSVELPIIDLQQYDKKEREIQLHTILQQESQRSFNLASDILLRGCLVQLAPQEYVLLLVMHHIASDGTSTNILWKQLTQLYKAFLDGKPNPLPKLPIQYADYAFWQRQWLSTEVLDKQLNYWKRQLAGAPSVLELPTDYPRPPVQTYNGASEPLALPQSLSDGLKRFCRQQGVTTYMTLLAAFQTLLYRYSGQEDIIVGSPIAGRNFTEVDKLIGFFVNTLVMRTQFQEHLSFLEVLKRVRQTAIEAYAHQDIPFEQLVQELQLQRSLSHSPLFQVIFTLQNDVIGTPNFPGLTCRRLEMESVAAKFDLWLSMKETQEGLIGYCEYNSDLFDRATIRRWIGHFQVLLEGIVDNPQQLVSQLPLLTEGERHQILVEWNNTATDYPQDKCIYQLFEEQVELTPDAVAVEFEDQQLTYRQLNNRVNQLAHYLQSLGVKPEVLVGICVERSLEMVVGLLGILKAGGAYVPIDPDYPKERLAYMLEDSSVPVLLTQNQLVAKLPKTQAQLVCLDTGWKVISQESQENPHSEVKPNNLSYVIYTSGSTGKPKGVQIGHQSLVNFINSMTNEPGLTTSDRLLAITTICFDIHTLEIYLPLTVGATIILASREVAMNGSKLASQLANYGVSAMQATPATWQMLLAANWLGSSELKAICGGETLRQSLANSLLAKVGDLWNIYGPTETTVWSTTSKVTPKRVSRHQDAPESIGQAIANTFIYILDSHLQPVPIGIPGELHIGGTGLARGYLNRPELTEQKFIPSPFSNEPGSRLYKTGDLARYLPDGNIEFLSRIDSQVKIRGLRIELGEIEARLTENSQVQEAVVIAREDIPGDKRLVAYIVSGETLPSISQLRSNLKQKLPDYMIPSAFVTLDALPLTPNGKINYRGLPAPDISRASEITFIPPNTPTQELLAAIWSQVLGIEKIGVDHNFFELGGHSLKATQVISQIRQVFGIELPLKTLFEEPTVTQLSDCIDTINWASQQSQNFVSDITEDYQEGRI